MKIGFNEATAKGCSDVETDVLLCEKAGFDYIEFRLDMLKDYLKHHRIEDLASLLSNLRIKPHALNAIYTYAGLFGKKDDSVKQTEFLVEYRFALDMAKQLGSRYLIVVPPMRDGNFTDAYVGTWEQRFDDCNRIYKRLGELALEYGVNLCLEPVGAPKCSIRTVKEADAVIRFVNMKNVGIVLDAYNLYMAHMDNYFEEIALLEPEKVFAVHLNNADDTGPSKEARQFCDAGVIDLSAFLKELKAKKYNGMASIETFRPEYWRMRPEQVIEMAYKTTAEILARNDCMA